jgi:fructose/tagatose bisphosphate aldolase
MKGLVMESVKEMLGKTGDAFKVKPGGVEILNEDAARAAMDELVRAAALGDDDTKAAARWLIRAVAIETGAVPASIHDYYMARAKGEAAHTSVPAINLRGLAYDSGRAVFRAAVKNNVGAFILELAKSETGYTGQPPSEYAPVILAAAVREGFQGPVFIQGDHYQVKMKKYLEDPEKEVAGIKALIKESIEAGYYNIDVDTSTTVQLDKPTIKEQQYYNSLLTAQLTAFIRGIEPEGVTVSVGGEIGEIGGKNSTPEETKAYLEGTREELDKIKPGLTGLSKLSVQTGTAHGGVVLPDGSIAEVALDFDVLKSCGEMARTEFGLGGVVQHGASTLPNEVFNKFPEHGTLEVHLATGFQNKMYDGGHLPEDFKNRVYDYINTNFASERKEGMTDEQFLYKTRKKGFGGLMKAEWWNLPAVVRDAMSADLEESFTFLFEKLGAMDTSAEIETAVKAVKFLPPMPEVLKAAL